MDSFFMERERRLKEIVDSAVGCIARMRNNECTGSDCEGCERRRILLDCMEGMDDYSRLVLNDRIEAAAIGYIKSNPTKEEIERQLDEAHEIRMKAIKRANRELNREWLASGGWIYIGFAIFTFVFFPIFGCMEWFL